jgi:hypothetical protein
MTDILTRATVLLEAREKMTVARETWSNTNNEIEAADGAFNGLAANTACEIIQDYQDLVRRIAEILDQHDRYNYYEYMGTPLFEETKNALEEARAALPQRQEAKMS